VRTAVTDQQDALPTLKSLSKLRRPDAGRHLTSAADQDVGGNPRRVPGIRQFHRSHQSSGGKPHTLDGTAFRSRIGETAATNRASPRLAVVGVYDLFNA